jgi:hypothetical protein
MEMGNQTSRKMTENYRRSEGAPRAVVLPLMMMMMIANVVTDRIPTNC